MIRFLLSISLALGPQFSYGMSCEASSGGAIALTAEELAGATVKWQKEVLEEVKPCEVECLTWPKSMDFSFTESEKFSVIKAAQRLRMSVHRALPTILDEAADLNQSGKKVSLEELLKTTADIITEEHNVTSGSAAEVKKGIATMWEFWSRIKGSLRLDTFELKPLVDSAHNYQKRIEQLRELYEDKEHNLISDKVMVGAGFGNLASRVILDTLKISQDSNKALDAISLLHPLTDNALDSGEDVKAAMAKITARIAGTVRELNKETKFEALVLDLVDDIFSQYPRDQHPIVQQLLMSLHKAQLDSVRIQRNKESTLEDILEITTRKGGLTGLIMAYLSKGRLSAEEAEYFYKAGSLFQMGDDLLDVKEDLADGTRTIWTMGLRSQNDFKVTLQTFLKLQTHLEAEAGQISDSGLSQSLSNDIQAGFKFYMIGAYLNSDLEKYMGQYLKDKIPLSPKNLRSILFSSYRNLTSIQGSDERLMAAALLYGRVFDHHFLANQYSSWEAQQSALRPYRLSHWNPLFLGVKFESKLTELIRKLQSKGTMAVGLSMAVSQLAMLAFPTNLNHPNLHGMLGVVAFTSMIGIAANSGKGITNLRPWAYSWLTSWVVTAGYYLSGLFP